MRIIFVGFFLFLSTFQTFSQVKFVLPNDSLKSISEKNWIYPDYTYAAELDQYYRKLFTIKKSFQEEERSVMETKFNPILAQAQEINL